MSIRVRAVRIGGEIPAIPPVTVPKEHPHEAVLAQHLSAGRPRPGPYVEGKEHIGGFTIIRATDLDSALAWGRKLARATTLPVEVRPFVDDPV